MPKIITEKTLRATLLTSIAAMLLTMFHLVVVGFPALASAASSVTETQNVSFRQMKIQGLDIAYREAGSATNPTVLLLHGFPTSSHMYRNLIPKIFYDE